MEESAPLGKRRFVVFFIVFSAKSAHSLDMTTTTRLSGLGGWLGRCLSVAVAIAFCSSAFAADPSKNVVKTSKETKKRVCYTYISNSGIPQPCSRLGAIPTTSTPMIVFGLNPEKEGR